MNVENTIRYAGIYATKTPNKAAIIIAETQQSLSYKDLHEYALKFVNIYDSFGLLYGDHVAFLTENRIECPALQCGAHYAGLYYTFINTRLKLPEVLYIVEDCDAKIIILSAQYCTQELVDAIQQLEKKPIIFVLDDSNVSGIIKLDSLLKMASIQVNRTLLEGNEMLYSAGTTGQPKGIKPELTRLPVGTTEIIANQVEKAFAVTDQTIYLSPAPYYHAAPVKWCRAILTLGGTVVLMEKFEAEKALETIEKYKITHSQWVPTMFHRILDLPLSILNQYDYSSLKVVIHAAAPCSIPTKQKMIEWWGPIIYEYYGSTEQIGMTMSNTQDWIDHPGTVGRAIYGIIHILDDEGEELSTGKIGNVYFSDSAKFSYHKDPAKTLDAYNIKGWACVGDIGYLDEDKFLYLTDRKSNMIISAGVNIYPQETENILIQHSEVMDIAVIGIPHPYFGESVHAVVQLYNHHRASDDLIKELDSFCRSHISSIKCPRSYEFRQDLPREPNGKLLKRLLRDEYYFK